MSNEVYTENIGDFGARELELAKKLLEAAKKGYPSDFDYDSGTKLAFNRNSGEVFLTNDDYQVCIEAGGDLYSFYYTPYSGHEGMLVDLIYDYRNYPDQWDDEDIEYLKDLCRDDDIIYDNDISDEDIEFVLGNGEE